MGVTIFYQFQSARSLAAWQKALLLITRLTALAVILFLLLQPSRQEKVPVPSVDKSVIFAIDKSISMKEPHRDGSSRIDAVRNDLESAKLLNHGDGKHRFMTIAETAKTATPDLIKTMQADGVTTRMHTSVSAILKMMGQKRAAGLFILSDGHDFDLIAAGETARATRARDLPIFTIPYGTAESARDVSIRIANHHPHTFVRQRTQLEFFIRSLGCPHESMKVDLLSDGKVVQTKTLNTADQSFQTVQFHVTHEKAGQFEYTCRVSPVANERELSNNSATTYLNVIADRIRILEIEGKPFWDSTFLRRSFARNDKFDIDSLVAFTGDRVRPIRSNKERSVGELKPPQSIEDLMPYNIVIFGRDVQRVIGENGIQAVEAWVKNHHGILVLSRGQAWPHDVQTSRELQPIEWDTLSAQGARLEVTPQASSIPAFRLLREVSAVEEFPEIITYPTIGSPKTLATTFSVSQEQAPAIIYRRYGSGQTIALGVGNLWRWVFNPKAEYDNNAYDRFWDQLALWLLANGGVAKIEGYSLRADTANLPLGETIRLRLMANGVEAPKTLPSVTILKDGISVTQLNLSSGENPTISHAEFIPKETGHYKAELTAPDGKKLATQFIVFRESMESTETAMDRTYLEQLANASGGRMIDPSEIAAVVKDLLRETQQQAPLTRTVPLWDKPWIFMLICFLLGIEWYARRRWGLT